MKNMLKKRVVITGIGIVSPLGCGLEQVWQRVLDGKSGITRIDPSLGLPTESNIHVCAKVPTSNDDLAFNIRALFPKGPPREHSNFINFAIVSSDEAIKHSKIDLSKFDLNRFGVSIGSGGIGALDDVLDGSKTLSTSYKKLSPYWVPRILNNMSAGQVSIRFGLKGPVTSVTTACAAGTHSIGDAFNLIRLGYADAMLAGASESSIHPLSLSGFARMKALSTHGAIDNNEESFQLASRPFDRKRNGFVMGEGSATLVLESLDSALQRHAPIIAEVCGYGLCGDGHHMTSPSPVDPDFSLSTWDTPSLDPTQLRGGGGGAQRSMATALRDAGISPHEVGYINAHATSTPMGDAIESEAIHSLFSSPTTTTTTPSPSLSASSSSDSMNTRNSPLYVSSLKGHFGHLLGAAGAVETAMTALALRDQVLPHTLNLTDPDPLFSSFQHILHSPHRISCSTSSSSPSSSSTTTTNIEEMNNQKEIRYALKNSFGFGGVNASLVLKRFDSNSIHE